MWPLNFEMKMIGKLWKVKSFSVTLSQIDLRMQQISYWPIQVSILTCADGGSGCSSCAKIVRIFVTWMCCESGKRVLICVLTMVRMKVASMPRGWSSTTWFWDLRSLVFWSNTALPLRQCSLTSSTRISLNLSGRLSFGSWVVEGWEEIHFGYLGWPAGLKLNSNLDAFLGELYIWLLHVWTGLWGKLIDWVLLFIVESWHRVAAWIFPLLILFVSQGVVVAFRPHMLHLVYFLGVSGFFGASITLSLMIDLLQFFTFHLYVFYNVSAKMYKWQLTVLLSLFNLFRGKKFNVLRNRLDSCDYDLDQLLLGTILFTLLFFLMPTTMIYYFFFCEVSLLRPLGLTIILKGLFGFRVISCANCLRLVFCWFRVWFWCICFWPCSTTSPSLLWLCDSRILESYLVACNSILCLKNCIRPTWLQVEMQLPPPPHSLRHLMPLSSSICKFVPASRAFNSSSRTSHCRSRNFSFNICCCWSRRLRFTFPAASFGAFCWATRSSRCRHSTYFGVANFHSSFPSITCFPRHHRLLFLSLSMKSSAPTAFHFLR